MATKLFLQDAAADIDPDSLVNKAAALTAGASTVSKVTSTAAGPTSPITITDGAGGTAIYWLSKPLNAVTISGTVTFNLWAHESAAAANSTVSVEVDRYDNSGAFVSTIIVKSQGTELGTTNPPTSARNFSGAPTSTSLSAGDRLAIIVQIDDATSVNMGSGRTVTTWYNGGTGGSNGDSWVQFTEAITEQSGGATKTIAPDAINGAATVTGTVVRNRAIPATVSGSSAVTASVVRTRAITAGVTGSSSVSGAVVRTRTFAASVNGSSTVTGAVGVGTVIPPSGVSGSSAVTAAVVRTRTFTLAINGTSTVTTGIVRARAITATVNGTSTVTATVTVPGSQNPHISQRSPRGWSYYII